MQQIVVEDNDKGKRIANFLISLFPKLTIGMIYKFSRQNMIKVNKKRVDPNYRLCLKDTIFLFIPENFLFEKENKLNFLKASKELSVVYEDENIILINKPIGLLCQEDKNTKIEVLSNQLLHYLFFKKEWDYKKENSFVPALINRIDRNTSGIVIAAKNAESLKILNEKMTLHEIKKFYLTKVHGIVSPKHAILKDYLQKDEQTNTVKIFKNKINNFSQEIITEYQVLSIDKEKDYSILEVQLHTGRTHQIRAHLSFYGYPLFGEKKYISSNKKYHDDKKYQSLISYKVLFKFTNDAGILNYLNNKIFSISSDIQNLLSLL